MMHGNAVGLDYHTNFVQVAVMSPSGTLLGNRKVDNDVGSILSAAAAYGPVGRVALEACCGAAELAEQLVQGPGWHVELAHPGYVARMKQTPDKSDFTDAQVLADLTRVGYLPRVWLAPRSVRELRALVRHRAALVDDRRRVKQRVRAVLREQRIATLAEGRPWTVRWQRWLRESAPLSAQGRWVMTQHLRQIEQLTASIAEVEQRLAQVTADDETVRRLQSHKGIGAVTAWILRAEIGQFDRFHSGKQLSRFCGLSPRNASSGQRQADAGLIKAGSTLLRVAVVEAAHRLIRYEPRWRDLAGQMRRRGKPGALIAAAIGNRWVRQLYHTMITPPPPPPAVEVAPAGFPAPVQAVTTTTAANPQGGGKPPRKTERTTTNVPGRRRVFRSVAPGSVRVNGAKNAG